MARSSSTNRATKEARRPVSPRGLAAGAARGGAADHPDPRRRTTHLARHGRNTRRFSKTALYRHFSDKQALLAAVGREGFRMLRVALTDAWDGEGRGLAGFEAMGMAYVQFAAAHPAHYRVMFGRFIESCSKDAAFVQEASAAFHVLVNALVEQQHGGTGAAGRSCPPCQIRLVGRARHCDARD